MNNNVHTLNPTGSERPEVKSLREAVTAAETTLDAAITATATLIAGGQASRAAMGLHTAHGMAAERQAAAALVNLIEAKGHLCGAHASMAKSAARNGLTVAVGPLDKPEDTPPIGDGPKRQG